MTRLRQAKTTTCPICRADLLVGLDGDVAALSAICDDQHLTRAGELLAVIAGRHVYDLDVRGDLNRRDRWTIRTPRDVVVPEHRCHEPIPITWRKPRPKPQPAPTPEEF